MASVTTNLSRQQELRVDEPCSDSQPLSDPQPFSQAIAAALSGELRVNPQIVEDSFEPTTLEAATKLRAMRWPGSGSSSILLPSAAVPFMV